MHIAILDDYQNAVPSLECFRLLNGHQVSVFTDTVTDTDALAARLADVEVLVLIRERTVISPELLRQLPKLKLISQTGKVSNHLKLEDCTAAGVAVAEGIGSPVAPAELCWALIMAARRHLPAYAANLQQGHWQSSGALGLGRVLKGQTLGIWGYGKIGQMVAGYGKAFGMQVQVWGREPSLAAAVAEGYLAASSREAFFEQADVLSLHLRLNDATRGIVTQADLQRMKTDALLVNVSRAELIEAGALEAAVAAGRPGYAAVDVYESEPILGTDHPLLKLPQVLCTPHIGYVEHSSYELYLRTAFDNVIAYAEGRPQNIANPAVLAN